MKKSVQNLGTETTGVRKKYFKPLIKEIYGCLFDLYGPQG
jgi:hypothetical protein